MLAKTTRTIIPIFALVVSVCSGQKVEGGRSVLSKLFETLSSSSTSALCPGRCFNAITAMACREVIDAPGMCPDPGYRCCQNLSVKNSNEEQSGLGSSNNKKQPEVKVNEDISSINMPSQLNSLPDDQSKNPSKLDKQDFSSGNIVTNKGEPNHYPSITMEVCPGVCVAKRISNYCEAAIDTADLCKRDLRCCVPSNLFEGVLHPPREFVILNPSTKNQTVEESRSEVIKPQRRPNNHPPDSRITTRDTASHPALTTISPFNSNRHESYPPDKEKNGDRGNINIPLEKRCKGTCVAGFFSFLCDRIDRSGVCPQGGKCCVAKPTRTRPSRPQALPGGSIDIENNSQDIPLVQNAKVTPAIMKEKVLPTTTTTMRTTTTTTPTLIKTTTEAPACTGTCLPVSLTSRCQRPSRLVVASGCRFDEVCCDDRRKHSSAKPGAKVPQALGTLLSLFGATQNGSPSVPPRKKIRPIRTTTTTTTTTTPSTTTEESLSECPGTCIAPILSFTCFGNAEISDLFRCKKEKQLCCAPKSSIRDMNRQNVMHNSIARNDTVFGPPTLLSYNQQSPMGGLFFGQSNPFSDSPFEKPSNFIHNKFQQGHHEGFQAPYYPPPPPPPALSHVQGVTHFEQNDYGQPPPPPARLPPYQSSQFSTSSPTQYIPYPQYSSSEPNYSENAFPDYSIKSSVEYQDDVSQQIPHHATSHQTHLQQEIPSQSHPQQYPHDLSQAQSSSRPEIPFPFKPPSQFSHHSEQNEENLFVTPQIPVQKYPPRPVYEEKQTLRYTYPPRLTQAQSHSTSPSTPIDKVDILTSVNTSSLVSSKYVCGVKGGGRRGRVVGGEDSVPGEWCWQVALINSLNQYLCGGALIGTQWVLTAAHCVTNIVRSGDAIYVRVGDHDLTTRLGSPGAQTIPVATTYIHHNHNSQTLDNDIALLKLSSHAELGEGVCLVCLPARGVSQVAGKRCTVTGYGYMGETGPIPLRIREAEIPVVSENECIRKINAVTEKVFILPASSFCAGGEDGHDACQGDGGGPLVCQVESYYELSGLVSWGFGCGRQDVPGVYVKVSSFIGWINQIISVNNT